MLNLFGAMVLAQTPVEVNIKDGPGTYNITNDSYQFVMKSYEVTGVKPENRLNLVKAIRNLLKNDGQRGGTVQVSAENIGGKEVTVMVVSATQPMQASVGQIVQQINRGGTIDFTDNPAVIFYRPKYGPVKTLEEVLKKEITPGVGYVYSDERTNVLTVGDDPTYIDYLWDVIKAYDVPPAQIIVEVTILETKSGVENNLGVHWDAWKNALPSDMTLELVGARSSVAGGGLGGLNITNFEGLISGISPQALSQFVNYLENRGLAEMRAKKTLNVVNNGSGNVHCGKEVPYQVLDKGQLDNRTAFVGFDLTAQATLATDMKCLSIKACSTSFLGFGANGAPIISTSAVDTAIGVNGEKTFVLSGLETTRSAKNTWGVPILDRIPVINRLFSWERSVVNEKWDAKIVIHIAPNSGV
ncbi:hypothetical protein HZA71_01260 [Candidatus Falkowbacteria bacterium]|nr:hypothetical protein [Candidatus Falkowbacteria bacterium]